MKYDIIIGLEIHAELKTKSKMFCSCPLRQGDSAASDNGAEGKAPNTAVCPVCLGHPGTLPVPNRQAIEWTILLGLALRGKISRQSKFDRKNYFYPDLPKGYQISQYDLPLVKGGSLAVDGEPIRITRVHLEEDTGKLTHPAGKGYSLVDHNRAGTPLIEMVTEPVIRDAATAKKFCQAYQRNLRYLEISDADMEKGQMRCEANVSIQEKDKWEYKGDGVITPVGGYKLNPKVELKNINSFRAVEKAINFEVKRQIAAIEDGEKLIQETRGWNEGRGETVRQRVKETSADYRYFPEPDIPPLTITEEWLNKIKVNLMEMPAEKKARFMAQYDFCAVDAEILAGDRPLADYTEQVISELRAWIVATGDDWERQKRKLGKTAANWLISELFKHLNAENKTIRDSIITPENFAEFIALVYQGRVNSSAAQRILAVMYEKGGDPTDIMAELGLEQIDDTAELEKEIKKIIEQNPKQAEQYRAGKENVLQYLVGQTMAATKGKANPKKAAEIIKKLI